MRPRGKGGTREVGLGRDAKVLLTVSDATLGWLAVLARWLGVTEATLGWLAVLARPPVLPEAEKKNPREGVPARMLSVNFERERIAAGQVS